MTILNFLDEKYSEKRNNRIWLYNAANYYIKTINPEIKYYYDNSKNRYYADLVFYILNKDREKKEVGRIWSASRDEHYFQGGWLHAASYIYRNSTEAIQ